jgi:hypothetical protein
MRMITRALSYVRIPLVLVGCSNLGTMCTLLVRRASYQSDPVVHFADA